MKTVDEAGGLKDILADIEKIIRQEVSAFTTTEERDLAISVAKDLATLLGRKFLGEDDLEAEIEHAKSAAASLSGAARNRVSYAIGRVFEQLMNKLFGLVLTIAA